MDARIATKYLVRIWPASADAPPDFQQSEMLAPESAGGGEAANDEAMSAAVREWALSGAVADGQPYRFEISRASLVAALAGEGPSQRVTSMLASGTVEPAGRAGNALKSPQGPRELS